MGRKGSWLCSMKKVTSPSSKEKKEKKARKSKGCLWKKNRKGLDTIQEENAAVNPAPSSSVSEVILVNPEGEQTKYIDSVIEAENDQSREAYPIMNSESVEDNNANVALDAESGQSRQAYVVARASATAAEAEVALSQEESAALKIQAVFRGYMARRALLSIKGLVRLKTLVQGRSVKRQSITTLRCMQTMSRVQSEVRARRIRMSGENSAFRRQLQQKHRKEVENSRPSIGEDWNGSAQSKEQIEAKKQRQLEAAIRRERTLAYAYVHQRTWRNSSTPTYTFMDPESPKWAWNWLERWMAVRPWENRAIEKEQIHDIIHVKSVTTLAQVRRDIDLVKKRQGLLSGRPSVSSPQTKTHNVRAPTNRKSVSSADGDARSTQSGQSDRCRRHNNVTQSYARDDESVASSSVLPSYMVPTESTKAKSRLSVEKPVLAEKDSLGMAKKRLSFSTPPAPRRHPVLN